MQPSNLFVASIQNHDVPLGATATGLCFSSHLYASLPQVPTYPWGYLMSRPRIPAALGALAVTAALLVGPATAAAAGGHRAPNTVAEGLIGPLHLDVSRHRVLVSQSFAGVISTIRRDGTVRDLIVEEPPADGVSAEVGGLATRGRTIAYTYASRAPGDNPDEPGEAVTTQLKIRKPGGRTYVLADLLRFEERVNPDQRRTYGFQDLSEECAADVENAGLGIPSTPYDGLIDSNPYEVAAGPGGGWYVADAGANAVLYVSKRGKIRVVYVAKPQRSVIDADAAAVTGLPDCVVGATFAFEPVPTDVEVAGKRLVVSHLPGGPEDESLGARGYVTTVNPYTGRSRILAGGFLGATNVAVGKHGKVYVTELFGNQVSVISRGKAHPFVDLPAPAAVEYAHGRLFVTTDVFANGSVVSVRAH